MDARRRLILALPPALLLAAEARALSGAIEGTAAYRERIALPPGATLEVALLDISRQGAPAERIAEATIPVMGQPPVAFRLAYDPARIRPEAMYSVEARLLREGRTLFRSDRINPVLTRGHGERVEILLVRARETAESPPALVGTQWVAEEIGGRGVVDRSRSSFTLAPDGNLYGSGGCNRFFGTYALAGDNLHLTPAGSTMMACAPALSEQEQRFLAALGQVRGWRLEGAILHLTDAAGAALIRLSRG